MTIRRPRGSLSVLLPSLFAACALFQQDLTPSEELKIENWLNCEECLDGEREAVRALGPRAVPRLIDALEDGPSSEHRDNMRRKFNLVFTTIHATAGAPDTSALPRVRYVERAVDNYVATYQKRAAQSLSDIGGTNAATALHSASTQSGYRADVIDAVQAARAAADTTARFHGVISPRTPAFGDTVVVRPAAFQPFDGDELAHIDGSPVAPNQTRVFGDANRFGFVAVGPRGRRVLTVRNVVTTPDTQYASITIRTLTDANDRRMGGCADAACRVSRAPVVSTIPSAFSTFLTLWRTPSSADTVDLVRFQPSIPLHLTASLAWSDSTTTNLDLRWADCHTNTAVGNTDGATSDHPERSTVDIPGGQCWLLLVLLSSPSPVPPVIAHLRVTP